MMRLVRFGLPYSRRGGYGEGPQPTLAGRGDQGARGRDPEVGAGGWWEERRGPIWLPGGQEGNGALPLKPHSGRYLRNTLVSGRWQGQVFSILPVSYGVLPLFDW